MNVGKMRFRVTLQQPPSNPRNEFGEISLSGTWPDVETVWAQIRPLSSNETIRARAAQLDTTHKVTIRYYPGLNSSWRLKDCASGAVYNIKGVIDPTMLRVEMQLDCVVSTDA